MRLFGNARIVTSRNISRKASTRLKHASLQGSVSRKNNLHHYVSCLLKRYGSSLQIDTKLETSSCSTAEKMALDGTGSLCEAF